MPRLNADVFDLLDRIGNPGWTGCEYIPRGGSVQGLGRLQPYPGSATAVSSKAQRQ